MEEHKPGDINRFFGPTRAINRKLVVSLVSFLGSDVDPKLHAKIKDISGSENSFTKPVERSDNTKKMVRAIKKHLKDKKPAWFRKMKKKYCNCVTGLDVPDYEKKRAKGSFSYFIDKFRA